jgi:SAM-dependent methyltransferase
MKKILLGIIQGYIENRYPNWNLDAALRYLPIGDYLNRVDPQTVLDVGSGGTGLSRYWGRPTIGLDFSPTDSSEGSLTRFVRGAGAALPFKDRSIDAVVCADVLEHVPAKGRERLLSELMRVSASDLILAVPCGIQAHRAEVEVERIYEERTGRPHPWLREHLDHGLPEAPELREMLRGLAEEEGRSAHIRESKNMNLRLWRLLFRHYFGGSPRVSRFIRYYMLTLLPVLRHMHWGEPYRRIFFIRLD